MRICFEKNGLPPHVLAVIRRGRCPALVPSSYYEDESGQTVICADTAGSTGAKELLKDGERGGLAGLLKTIRIMRSVCEARQTCRDWFIDPTLTSTAPEDIYLDERGFARLIIRGPGADVPRDMRGFLRSLDQSFPRLGAGELLAILEQRGLPPAGDEKGLIRLLGEVERELGQ